MASTLLQKYLHESVAAKPCLLHWRDTAGSISTTLFWLFICCMTEITSRVPGAEFEPEPAMNKQYLVTLIATFWSHSFHLFSPLFSCILLFGLAATIKHLR